MYTLVFSYRHIIENKFYLTKHTDFSTCRRISENGGTENYSMRETKTGTVVLRRSGDERRTSQRILAAKKRCSSRYVHLASQKFDYVESLRCRASATLFAEWPPNPFVAVREGLSINPHFHSASTRPKRKTEYEGRKDVAAWISSSFRLQFAAWSTSAVSPCLVRLSLVLMSSFSLSSPLPLSLAFSSLIHLSSLDGGCTLFRNFFCTCSTGRQRHNCIAVAIIHRVVWYA